MFNDCIAVLFGYLSIFCFSRKQFRFGSLVYSIAVSIKMNMLLYSPAILLIYLIGVGYIETIICLSICAITQLVIGYPFLSTYPKEYLLKSFELTRVFMYKWTVNFKFLSEDLFLNKYLSIVLLLLTVVILVFFVRKWIVEVSVVFIVNNMIL